MTVRIININNEHQNAPEAPFTVSAKGTAKS